MRLRLKLRRRDIIPPDLPIQKAASSYIGAGCFLKLDSQGISIPWAGVWGQRPHYNSPKARYPSGDGAVVI